jgi:hypothetical protein
MIFKGLNMRVTDQFEHVKLVINDNSHTEQHLAINCSYAYETLAGTDKPPYIPPLQKSHETRNTGPLSQPTFINPYPTLRFINVLTPNI